MFRSRRLNKLTVFIAVGALLLEAAVPMIASAAAALRGVPIAEVCEVYGVALPALDPPAHHHMHMASAAGSQMPANASEGAPTGHHDHGAGAHKGDHCALTGLAALAPSGSVVKLDAQVRASFRAAPLPSQDVFFDAAAMWAARLKHGPPPAQA
jgi:hypothetical protein